MTKHKLFWIAFIACGLGFAPTALADDVNIDDQLDLANGLYSRGMYDMAFAEYDRLIQKYPDHPKIPSAHFRAGETLFYSKQYEKAISQYQAFVRQYPEASQRERSLTYPLSKKNDPCFRWRRSSMLFLSH